MRFYIIRYADPVNRGLLCSEAMSRDTGQIYRVWTNAKNQTVRIENIRHKNLVKTNGDLGCSIVAALQEFSVKHGDAPYVASRDGVRK